MATIDIPDDIRSFIIRYETGLWFCTILSHRDDGVYYISHVNRAEAIRLATVAYETGDSLQRRSAYRIANAPKSNYTYKPKPKVNITTLDLNLDDLNLDLGDL